VILRADSAYYGRDVIAAARRHEACFSITARKDRAIIRAIASIDRDAWTAIRYPRAIFDEQLGQWASDAEVAESAVHRVRLAPAGAAHQSSADCPPGA
jgi:hypothetical protein